MRKQFIKITTAVCALFLIVGVYNVKPAGAAQPTAVDTITLETEASSNEDISVDLKWKRQREGGTWIGSLNVADGVDSLVLILNDEDGSQNLQIKSQEKKSDRVKKREMQGNSRLLYYSKNGEGEWQEIFSTTCILSGGMTMETEDLFGLYRAENTFGIQDNPGSLVPYQKLSEKDYWIMDEDSDDYGSIVTVGPKGVQTAHSVQLESMKAYSNYGIILKPENEDVYPALVINCQQADAYEDTLSGIQVPQLYVRMLLQSVDSETRIVIASDVTAVEDM